MSLGHNWKTKSNYEHAQLQKAPTHGDGFGGVMHNDWTNRGLAFQHGEARFANARANSGHIGAQLGHALRLTLQDFNGAICAASDGCWKRVGK